MQLSFPMAEFQGKEGKRGPAWRGAMIHNIRQIAALPSVPEYMQNMENGSLSLPFKIGGPTVKRKSNKSKSHEFIFHPF